MRNPQFNKDNLIKLIIQAGLEDDFMKWLSERGYSHIFGRLDNIPLNLVIDYVKSMKLTDEGEDEYRIYYEPSLDNVEEPDDVMKRITGTSGKRKPRI